ncbi:MAG: DUF4230 domain-containing protein [Clostridiales bacterium]|nr:DUF4230 domain-containing protein [Clostridiales bacterium]
MGRNSKFTEDAEYEDMERTYSQSGESNGKDEYRLRRIIEESVDESVDKAFRKYRVSSAGRGIVKSIIALVVVVCVVFAGVYYWQSTHKKIETKDVEDYDLTLENNGIFGFTAVDFEEAILGESTRQKLLIVEEQDVFVNTTITDTGFKNWSVFSKQQALTIYGYGQYTVDLSEISEEDISLDEDTYEVTIKIPHAELHETVFNPDETEIGDTDKGWLAFGDIELTAEQNQEFEEEAIEKLTEKLSEDERFEEADKFAKLSAYETYQPIVSSVSTAYKVVIEFQD